MKADAQPLIVPFSGEVTGDSDHDPVDGQVDFLVVVMEPHAVRVVRPGVRIEG